MEKKNYMNFGYVRHPGVKFQKSKDDLEKLLRKRPFLSIKKYENPNIVRSRFPFHYERFDEQKLRLLRKKYKLDKVIEKGRTEFEKMVLLREWVKSRWRHGTPKTKNHNQFNALQLLERAEKGEKFFCCHYTVTFIQCCLSLGWQARFVAPLNSSGHYSHAVTEVWSNQYRKWVIMDTDYNIHYVDKRIPMNALELHNAWLYWGQRLDREPEAIKGYPRPEYKNAIDTPYIPFRLLDCYFYFAIRMRNNFFSNIGSEKNTLKVPQLKWYDKRTPRYGAHYYTNRPEDLYWGLNQTHITIGLGREETLLKVYLNTVTPNFEHYIVEIDRKKMEIIDTKFNWRIHLGLNRLKVKTVNKFCREGISSQIILKANLK